MVTVEATVRLVTMVLAGLVACAGFVVMAGLVTREGLPVETRILLGAVVFLYGVYKFTVTYFRKPERDDR
ncbi:MAG: hypothetical protein AB1428_11595 [Bacteroidota bacterium]